MLLLLMMMMMIDYSTDSSLSLPNFCWNLVAHYYCTNDKMKLPRMLTASAHFGLVVTGSLVIVVVVVAISFWFLAAAAAAAAADRLSQIS
jgi:hypothetical protein